MVGWCCTGAALVLQELQEPRLVHSQSGTGTLLASSSSLCNSAGNSDGSSAPLCDSFLSAASLSLSLFHLPLLSSSLISHSPCCQKLSQPVSVSSFLLFLLLLLVAVM